MSTRPLKVVESQKPAAYYDAKKQELFDSGYVKIHEEENYKRKFAHMEKHNLGLEIHKKFSYKDNLIDHDDKRRQYCQPRNTGVDVAKVEDYTDRFRNGENQDLPIMGLLYEDGKANPFVGNQRGLAQKKLEESTGSATSDFCELTHPTLPLDVMHYHASVLAGISNAKTSHDIETSSSDDIVTNINAIWKSFCKIEPGAEYWTEEQKIDWAKQEIVLVNPAYSGPSFATVVGRLAAQCFSSDHGVRNDTVKSTNRLAQIFKDFFPNNMWDVGTTGFTKNGVFQQLTGLSWNVKQVLLFHTGGNIDYPDPDNPETWSHTKSRTPVHLMFEVCSSIKCISSRETKAVNRLKHLTSWNRAEKNVEAGSFLVEKVVFLAGFQECDHEAYQWNAQMKRFDKVVIK
jgi:hypothetical protein